MGESRLQEGGSTEAAEADYELDGQARLGPGLVVGGGEQVLRRVEIQRRAGMIWVTYVPRGSNENQVTVCTSQGTVAWGARASTDPAHPPGRAEHRLVPTGQRSVLADGDCPVGRGKEGRGGPRGEGVAGEAAERGQQASTELGDGNYESLLCLLQK